MSGPSHEAYFQTGLLGPGSWHVRRNGFDIIEDCLDQKTAQLRAAALNYGSQDIHYGLLGLDGVDLHFPRGWSGETWITKGFTT